MANIKILGDAMVVTSSTKLETIKLMEKFRPRALKLYEKDNKGVEVEKFSIATRSEGSITKYGAVFNGQTHDEEKLATITLPIPQGTVDPKEYAFEKIGTAILLLTELEKTFADVETEILMEKEEIRDHITLV